MKGIKKIIYFKKKLFNSRVKRWYHILKNYRINNKYENKHIRRDNLMPVRTFILTYNGKEYKYTIYKTIKIYCSCGEEFYVEEKLINKYNENKSKKRIK